MPNLTFDADLVWLNLVWVALAVGALGLYGVWQRRRALRVFADPGLLARLAPPIRWSRGLLRVGLITGALLALVVALLGPRWGEATQQLARRNIDVMVVLDVSRSMLARDIAPSRLERAKLSIRDDLLPALGGDRIGLVVFAGRPVLKCPLTSDYGFFRLVLDEVSTNSVAVGGTMIGDGIRKAADAFNDQLDSHKIILLITDGEDQQSYPLEAAAGVWADKKIPVVAVALGDEREGARIPVETKGDAQPGEQYVQYKGETVWSRANFDALRRIAAVSDLNAFVAVGTKDFDLGAIYRGPILRAIKAEQVSESRKVRQPSRYHPFAVAALVLLLLESGLRDVSRKARAAVLAPVNRGEAA